jgi:2-aminoadipate transaminase
MLMSRALANPELISLAAGFVDQSTLPVAETHSALQSLFADVEAACAALQYGTTPGYPPLRELLLQLTLGSPSASDVRRQFDVEHVVVTAGSNQLLHLVLESIANPGDIVLCAAPTYLVVLGTIANLGARSVGVAIDEQGMIPEALEESLRAIERAGELARVRAIYLIPYFDNPCGVTMPLDRAARIVEIARAWSRHHQIYVLADEAYRELRYSGDDIPSVLTLDAGRDTVIAAGTFSKSFSPGIRVGWGVLPDELIAPVCSQKGNIDFGSPNFSQHLMWRVLDSGQFASHVLAIRAGYRLKLEAMRAAADVHLKSIDGVRWQVPRGGLYLWVELPEGIDAGPNGKLFDAAIAEGVLYVPGQYCFPGEGEPVRCSTMRLSFGVQSSERIGQGIEALGRAVRRVLG